MAVSFNWKIINTERDIATGGILAAWWMCEGVDGDIRRNGNGAVSLTPDSESPDFIPYEDLTEAQILEWVWAVDGIDKSQVEQDLNNLISEIKNPTLAYGLPWVSEE